MLVGGGHAHVVVLREFARLRPRARIRLISDRAHSLYSGMVPGWLEGRYRLEDCTVDVRELARRAGGEFVHGKVCGLDLEARRVHLENGDVVGYDVLSLAVGSTTRTDPSEAPTPALGVRPIGAFVAEVPARLDRTVPVAVVGGGAAGVELAATLSARPGRGALVLLEAERRLLPQAPSGLQDHLLRFLQERGVDVRTEARVLRTRPGALELADGSVLPSGLALWATAARPHPWLGQAGLPIEDAGFLIVDDTLRVPGNHAVYAAGDCAVPAGFPALSRSGVHAVRQGGVLAHNLLAEIEGGRARRFRPRRQSLVLLNLGAGHAAGYRGSHWAVGPVVMRLKDVIDRRWVRGALP